MLKVGLTGGIATGKTSVARMLEARAYRVLYADRIAHELVRPGQSAYDEVVQAFGRDILAADGEVDRSKLAAIVFSDRGKLDELNRIVHPRVMDELDRKFAWLAVAEPDGIVFVEAALLLESGYAERLDKLVVTWCWPEQQIERLAASGLARAEAERRVAAQMPQEEKRRRADFEIDCSGTIESTRAQLAQVVAALEKLAARAAS